MSSDATADAADPMAPAFRQADNALALLRKRLFDTDPLVAPYFSRVASVVSSAYKRHGHILEAALTRALETAPHLQVWTEPDFRLTSAAVSLALSSGDATALKSSLPYDGTGRRAQVDLLVYDTARRRLGAYESKRGTSPNDAGKNRSIIADLRGVQMLLRSYGERRGLDVEEAAARVVFYYGAGGIGPPWSLDRAQLDEHFGAPIVAHVERVNAYFGARLNELLTSL
jgi:hypothetical protein